MSRPDDQSDERAAHENGLAVFLVTNQARRISALLAQTKGRAKALTQLAHGLRFAPEFALKIPPAEQTSAGILALLKKAGAGSGCYLMSEDRKLDGVYMTLEKALSAVVGGGYSTFLSCLPGKLAYYEGEGRNERYILCTRQ